MKHVRRFTRGETKPGASRLNELVDAINELASLRGDGAIVVENNGVRINWMEFLAHVPKVPLPVYVAITAVVDHEVGIRPLLSTGDYQDGDTITVPVLPEVTGSGV